MAEGAHTRSRGRTRLVGGAIVLLIAAFVFAVSGYRERRDAGARLERAEAALMVGRAAAADADAELAAANATVTKLAPDTNAVLQRAETATKLDVQEAALFQQGLQAGIGGDVAAFNQAVAQRNALNASHDAALDGLRAPVDALFAGLDGL